MLGPGARPPAMALGPRRRWELGRPGGARESPRNLNRDLPSGKVRRVGSPPAFSLGTGVRAGGRGDRADSRTGAGPNHDGTDTTIGRGVAQAGRPSHASL